jgi:hypothetical protein
VLDLQNPNAIVYGSINPSGVQNVDGILSGYAWASTNLTYSFPNSPVDYWINYAPQYPDGAANSVTQLTAQQQSEVQRALSLISSYTKLTLTQITETEYTSGEGTQHAVIRLANSGAPATSYSFDPGTGVTSGDVFYGPTGQNPVMGNFNSGQAIFHEIGHALGLAHGQQTIRPDNGQTDPGGPFGNMDTAHQDIEYSVMNYSNYIGASTATNATAGPGSSEQTYMMYDIAALQYMYGANFSQTGQNVTYTWDSVTGQEFINGVGQGVPQQNSGSGKIFETVWTGGANSTFDLSNFNDNAILDMRPGQSMLFSNSQLADLGYKSPGPGPGIKMAQGNVYNALLYHGDLASEIDNIITGNGSDTVIGNDVYNHITLGNGNDTVTVGGAGATIVCGAGTDTISIPDVGACTIQGAGTTTLDYSAVDLGPITVDIQNGRVVKPGGIGVFAVDTFTNVQVFDGDPVSNTFKSIGTGNYTFNGQGTSNTLDYSADMDANGVTIDLKTDTVTKDQKLSFQVESYHDNFSDIQNFVGSGLGNARFKSIGTGDYTFTGNGVSNTLDYSADTDANGVTIDLKTDTATKDQKLSLQVESYHDNFSDIQNFVGSGSGNTRFKSIGTGDYTFTGNGVSNTLDYSADTDANGVTINLKTDTVTKDQKVSWQVESYQDNFSDIQNFVGSEFGNTRFESIGTDGYTFTGKSTGNTLDYSADANGVKIDLTTNKVSKDISGFNLKGAVYYQDSFSDIQSFVGGSGNTTFKSIGTDEYTFKGQGVNNTLDYSADASGVTIDLTTDTVKKDYDYSNIITGKSVYYQDQFSDIQNFVGGYGVNTVVFHGAHSEYSINTSLDANGLLHTEVVDQGAAGDGTIDLTNVQLLQFADKTLITLEAIGGANLGVLRVADTVADASSVAANINAGKLTFATYVNQLINEAQSTTVPAVAVEASMYGAVGSSAEITKLVTQFLPAQVANAPSSPQVYVSEVLGLVFAFGDENGGTGFATNFGPANAAMPATFAGDAAFAAAAAKAIFGAAANANTPIAILGWVSNWEAFYTHNGVPGIANPTFDQIDLAARGAAWGDAVGAALNSNLGPLHGQVVNFLGDAAQETAIYSAPFSSQPLYSPFH